MTTIAPFTVFGAAALFVLVFVLGFLLRRSVRPYSGLVLTAHKLISLATLILLGVNVYRINEAEPLASAPLVVAVLTGVLFVVAIVSGGLVSIDRPTPSIVRALHWVTPFLTVACAAATLILLP